MTNTTTRRRGRHAAPAAPVSLQPPPLRIRRAPDDRVRLPGMELLGFYDEPYQIAVHRETPKRRPTNPVVQAGRTQRPSDSAISRITSLWETTDIDETALDWWKPHVVARRKLGGRRFRASSVGWAAFVAVLAILSVWQLLTRPAQVAEESMTALRADAAAMVASLPALEGVASAIGNREPPDLSASTAVVLDAESASREVFTAAGALEGTARQAGVGAAGEILEVTSRVNRLIAYRLSAERALVAPELPTTPDGTDLPSATESVTAWRAEVETTLADLPGDMVPGHYRSVQRWLEGLDAWQTSYLDGIRQEDAVAMGRALQDLESQLSGLHEELLAQLEQTGGELVTQIAEARSTIEPLLGD